MNVEAQEEAARKVAAIVSELPDEDQRNLGANYVRGYLERARIENNLVPTLSAILDVDGLLLVLVTDIGVNVESTSREGDERATDVIKDLKRVVYARLDERVRMKS